MADSINLTNPVVVTEYTTVYVTDVPTVTTMPSMADPSYPSDLVIVTEYTTVYVTDAPMATDISSLSSTANPTLASTGHLLSGLSSSMSGSNSPSPLMSSLSGTTVSISSPTGTLSLPSFLPAPDRRKQKFNDTFPLVILALLILLAVLLIAMVVYMLYVRYKGQCLKCHSMEKQIRRWESGELKCITPNMVREREMLNRTAAQQDLERGTTKETEPGHTEVSVEIQATKTRSFWQKAKNVILRNIGAPSSGGRGSQGVEVDRFFTVSDENSDASISTPVSPVSTSSLQVSHEANNNSLQASHGHRVPPPSLYSQPRNLQSNHANRARVFADISTVDGSNPRAPLRTDEPKRYTAYVTSDDSSEYPGSAAPQQTEQVDAQQGQYQMIEWRKRGRRPPEPEDG